MDEAAVKLYQYCVYKHPTTAETLEGKKVEVLIPPGDWELGTVDEIRMRAMRKIPEAEIVNASRLEVVIRPF